MDSDMPEILRVLAAFLFVMALMGGLVIILRRMGLAAQNAGSKKRLKIVEVLYLDSRRKLAIVQRDDKQHLLVLGPNSETVIETSIESPQDTRNDA
jgi:flagellar protein FliO/FliZ